MNGGDTAPRADAGRPGDADRDGGRSGDEGEERVDRRAVAVWRWTALASALPPAAAVIGLTAAAPVGTAVAAAFWPALAVAAGLLVFAVVWYPPARYRRLAYRVDETGIRIRDGVFWRSHASLARARIQHTDVSQGPLQRRYGVATLKLYTAGSRFTRIQLPGVEHDQAVALRDRLQRDENDESADAG